jgi:hypothetical protein
MSVRFITESSSKLLKKFNDAIDQEESKGSITTWKKVQQGDTTFYTHVADEWTKKAYFKAVVLDSKLKFNIVRPKDKIVDQVVYAYYHGHLIETFLRHFPHDFTDARADAVAQDGDNVKPPSK